MEGQGDLLAAEKKPAPKPDRSSRRIKALEERMDAIEGVCEAIWNEIRELKMGDMIKQDAAALERQLKIKGKS